MRYQDVAYRPCPIDVLEVMVPLLNLSLGIEVRICDEHCCGDGATHVLLEISG